MRVAFTLTLAEYRRDVWRSTWAQARAHPWIWKLLAWIFAITVFAPTAVIVILFYVWGTPATPGWIEQEVWIKSIQIFGVPLFCVAWVNLVALVRWPRRRDMVVEIGPEELVYTIARQEYRRDWQEVSDIGQDRDNIWLIARGASPRKFVLALIPKRVFANAEDAGVFLARAMAYREAAISGEEAERQSAGAWPPAPVEGGHRSS